MIRFTATLAALGVATALQAQTVDPTSVLGDDDGRSFSHKLLLCDDGEISYPSATLGKDGSIYIVYDQGRGAIGQHTIFLSKISEEDILAGELVKGESFLNTIVSRPSDRGGGRREGDAL